MNHLKDISLVFCLQALCFAHFKYGYVTATKKARAKFGFDSLLDLEKYLASALHKNGYDDRAGATSAEMARNIMLSMYGKSNYPPEETRR